MKERYDDLIISETLDGFDLTDQQIRDYIYVETLGTGKDIDKYREIDVELKISSDGKVRVGR